MEKSSILAIALIGTLIAAFAGWTLYSLVLMTPLADDKKNGGSDELEVITVAGSTTCFPIIDACAEVYMDDNDNADIRVSGGGSTYGIDGVGIGTLDIGMASRKAVSGDKDAEWEIEFADLIETRIAYDGIAVIISTSNTEAPISLSVLQLRGIFNNTYNDWSDVGAGSGSITVIGRAAGSGTRSSFCSLIGLSEPNLNQDQSLESNGAVKSAVSADSIAIGYVGLGYVDGTTVESLKVNGVECNATTVKDATYPISRSLYVYTGPDPSELSDDFIAFVLSNDGQDIVEDEGFVKL